MDPRTTPTTAKRSAPDPARPGRFLLSVTWQDQRVSAFPWGYLKALCPCAICRGMVISEVESGTAADAPDEPARQITGLQHVGHYALGVSWADGHQSIFPWDYLRSTDPTERSIAEIVATLREDPRLRG
ncbi:MAG: DUF971 domain-containing protein [Planctomycetes bacterium]|nr:DUF971 domain-containing protein [Planctomycetota bacterium]